MSQFHRLIYIDRMIHEFGVVTKKQVADEFQVTIWTVKGDFRYMKYEVDAPIAYSRQKKGYYYTSPDFNLFNFGHEKMFLFFVLLKQLASNRNFMPFDTSKFIEAIKNDVDPEYLKLSDRVSFELSEFEYPDMAVFETVIKAMQQRNVLKLDYIDAKGKVSKRSVEPLHIFNYQGKWTLLAHCRLREAMRMFNLSRMKSVVSDTSRKFDRNRHSKTEIGNFLSESFGIARGKEKETAVIRFYEPTTHHILDQKWHPEQKTDFITEKGNNIVQFTLPVAKYEELVGRVLRFSPDAEIISPPAMRQMWLDKLKAARKKYK
ncbi:MAG TPA: WYL domain-containing protein [Clostridiales bacterium]|nr:WYL domain-containing protein [Clostridiales bacterium]